LKKISEDKELELLLLENNKKSIPQKFDDKIEQIKIVKGFAFQ